jgi:hypothetical protein
MRRLIKILAGTALLFSSCSNLKKLDTYDDDVYNDPVRDKVEVVEKKKTDEPVTDSNVKKQDPDLGNENAYYRDPQWNRDDYYDYEYAARLRRFNGNAMGLAYYDPYFTNSYFYDYNPYHYGVSIYTGYNWYGPTYWNYSYNPYYNWGGWYGCGNNLSWGFGYYDYPSSYFFAPSPWNSPYGFYDPYAYGYANNSWYWNNYYSHNPYGYCGNTYLPYYYNTYDYNSYYYGPRLTHAGTNQQTVNPGQKKMNPGKNETEHVVPSPYDPERFNAAQPMKNVNTGNYSIDDFKNVPGKTNTNPVKNSNSANTNTNVINAENGNQNTSNNPKQGFWKNVIKGKDNMQENNNHVYHHDVITPNENSGTNNNPGKNNVKPSDNSIPSNNNNTPKNFNPRKNEVVPKNNDTYTPMNNNNNNNNYSPKGNNTVNPGGNQNPMNKRPR